MSDANPDTAPLAFIGLGVMGEPMCRNLAQKCGVPVRAFDALPEPMQRLSPHGVLACTSVGAAVADAGVVFLSLPSGEVVHELAHASDGLLALTHAGQIVVDLGTSPVETTRRLAQEFAARGATFIPTVSVTVARPKTKLISARVAPSSASSGRSSTLNA